MTAFGSIQHDPAAGRIRQAATRGALTHALLFTGAGQRETLARYAAAAMECECGGKRPCLRCESCRRVMEGIHPDVITVRDDQHKSIAVDVVRQIRQDAYIRPNQGRRKVYLFPDCALLTPQDQNVLLKIVEEGPPYAAFLFCAENAAVVLQTLRSRCVELKLHPDGAPEAQEPSDAGDELIRLLASFRRGAAAEWAARMEKRRMTREELSAMLERGRAVCAEALLRAYGCQGDGSGGQLASAVAKNLTKRQIMGTIELLEKYRGECVYNVGPSHVLGALAVELEGIL